MICSNTNASEDPNRHKSALTRVPLSEFVQFRNGKKRPSGIGCIPVYGGNGVMDNTDVYNQENGIIIGRVGAYCGNVFHEVNKHWVSDNAISAVPRSNSDIVFIYYLLKSLNLNRRHIGTSQPLLTQEILNSIYVLVPSLEVQIEIGRTLQVLDDKIANNTAINHQLEQIAQAIFKSWFVDFEPWGGVMPDDWRVGTLGEIIEVFDYRRVPLSGMQREKMEKIYPYYGAAALMDYVDDFLFDGIYLLLGEDGTVVDELGFPILQYVWGKFWVNNHAHVLQGKNGFTVESLYVLLQSTSVSSIVTGAVQKKINQSNLKSIQILVPSEIDINRYNNLISPLFSLIRNNQDENKGLTSIRDAILPRLLSGELSVSDLPDIP